MSTFEPGLKIRILGTLNNSECGVGVGDEHLEVCLEPGAGLGSGLLGVRETAVGVVAGARGVRGTVALASGLDPDDGVDERRAGVGRRAGTEAGVVDVAPVTPLLADVLDTGAALVDDEVRGEALLGQQRREGVDVELLIVAGECGSV